MSLKTMSSVTTYANLKLSKIAEVKSMKKLSLVTCSTLFVFSSMCYADFDFKGEGALTYPTGVEKTFEFGFAWNKQTEQFRIGASHYDMSELPESYSVAITLSKDDTRVWIQEFNQGFISEFKWQIADHQISLVKKEFSDSVKGNYVLTVNGIDYFFARDNVSITLSFEEDGIKNIKVDGVTKDMGTKS
ncbi:hypothetical protein [Pseudoalteromonas piscicida]|uniref:hypothetical protein n=1 Tax=Pseudoalteromonas piscicida TaxID=43662 RepID=UPI0005FA24F6|nr:hypothetical protein [Pseudoalteromonas piscicida]KJZ01597.1 hypothetical protein TW73_13965 [Pseudoalteromonas piscicida]